jgi:uncharacterized NAD(P)/FAD-binding protein YdhS
MQRFLAAVHLLTHSDGRWRIVLIERDAELGGGVAYGTDATWHMLDRSRVLWFDPGRHLWVKYTEKMHGQQNYGVTFTYDEDVTATLQSFAPG